MKRFCINKALNVLVICVFVIMAAGGCGKKEETVSKAKTGSQVSSGSTEEMPVPSSAPITEERVYYDFETDLNGWEIPMWAEEKTDYVAENVEISSDVASHGKSSMKIATNFTGGVWTAALAEIQQYLDLSPYRVIMFDVYLPEDAPEGLKVKGILTVGENWKFVEMSRSMPLVPGQWTTISANIEPGSYDWKRVVPDEKFAEDVRKIAIRVVSNRKPAYSGPIYIDNVRMGR